MNRRLGALALVAAVDLWVGVALADGGRLILREARDGVIASVLAAPVPLRVGAAAFDVLVQDPDTGAPMAVDAVRLRVTGPDVCGTTELDARTESGVNRLFYGASMRLPMPGRWQVEAWIETETGATVFTTELEVAPALPPAQRYWPWIAATLVGLVVLFVHQARTLGRPRSDRRSPGRLR